MHVVVWPFRLYTSQESTSTGKKRERWNNICSDNFYFAKYLRAGNVPTIYSIASNRFDTVFRPITPGETFHEDVFPFTRVGQRRHSWRVSPVRDEIDVTLTDANYSFPFCSASSFKWKAINYSIAYQRTDSLFSVIWTCSFVFLFSSIFTEILKIVSDISAVQIWQSPAPVLKVSSSLELN